MKIILTIILFIIKITCSYAQPDSVVSFPNEVYMENIFNPETGSMNPSYNYSNKWDVDGDSRNDSVYFIGNGGAHVYFYLRIILTSDGVLRDFPFINLDMPYETDKDLLDKYGRNPGVQFVVYDFDKDGIADIYLNFNNSFNTIPKDWKRMGVTGNYIIMNFAGGKLRVRNY